MNETCNIENDIQTLFWHLVKSNIGINLQIKWFLLIETYISAM